MPQLDTFTFVSQFFWFGITFWTLYVVVFCFFIVPAAFITKAQSVMRTSSHNSMPSSDVMEKTNWSHMRFFSMFTHSEKARLESSYTQSAKNFFILDKKIRSGIFKSTSFQAPLVSFYSILASEKMSSQN